MTKSMQAALTTLAFAAALFLVTASISNVATLFPIERELSQEEIDDRFIFDRE